MQIHIRKGGERTILPNGRANEDLRHDLLAYRLVYRVVSILKRARRDFSR